MGEQVFEAGQVRRHPEGTIRILTRLVDGKWHAYDPTTRAEVATVGIEFTSLVAPAPKLGQPWYRDGQRGWILGVQGKLDGMEFRAPYDCCRADGPVAMAMWLRDHGWQHNADAPASVAPPTLPTGNQAPAPLPALPAIAHGDRFRCPSGDVWTVAARDGRVRLERGARAMPWAAPAELARYLAENRFEVLPTWEQARWWIDTTIASTYLGTHAERPWIFARALRHLGERTQDVEPPTQWFIHATVAAITAAERRLPERDAIACARDAFAAAMGGDELWWIAGAAVDLYIAARSR